MVKKIPEWKKQLLASLSELTKSNGVLAIADLQKVRSSQIQEIRKKLRGKVQMIVAKNTILKKVGEALAKEKKGLAEFTQGLTGSNLLLFTNMNPFALLILLNKNKVRALAKAGDVAVSDVMIPAGNTGLAPGPVISEFGEAKVPTRIESGSIWVAKDTIVAKKGDVISPKLASVLSKLNIKPMEAGLSLKAAYDNGYMITGDSLTIDLDKIKNNFSQAHLGAIGLTIEAEYFLPDNAEQILRRAFRESMAVAGEAGYLTSETANTILRRAYVNAVTISTLAKLAPEETGAKAS